MKRTIINTIIALCLICSFSVLIAQTAQPQNPQQNAAPTQHGNDPNVTNPGPNQGNNYSNPGNNNNPGSKPTNGSYGTPNTQNPNGASGPSGRGTNSGATGISGVTGPIYNNNGSGPAKSPQ